MPLKHTVEEVKLKNGATGLLIDVPGASVMYYQIDFHAGNQYALNPSIEQTAHIMEHMTFKATKNYPSQNAFSQEFTKNGAYNNATTWSMNMAYWGDCADMEWDRILDMQREAITEPLFTQHALDTEKRNVREELSGQAADHNRVLWQKMSRSMGDTSLNDKEKIETIDAVKLSDIIEHHERTHTHNNMRFIISGRLGGKRREQILAMFENWMLPKGHYLPPQSQKLHKGELVHIKRPEMSNIQYALSMVINRRLTTDEEYALGLLNHILTGTFHSRIFGEARAAGISYSMGSEAFIEDDDTSAWNFYGQVTLENTQAVFELICRELQRISEGDLSQAEILATRQFGLGNYQKSAQTVGDVANIYFGNFTYNGSFEPYTETPKRIERMNKEAAITLAREFLASGIWCFGAVGNITKAELRKSEAIFANFLEGNVE